MLMEKKFCCVANSWNDPLQISDFITKPKDFGKEKKKKRQENILYFFSERRDIKLK